MYSKALSYILATMLISMVNAAYDASSKSNIAVYWGQNSYGTQERLSTYCTDDVGIVLLSFMTSFPDSLSLNFANQCSDSFSDGLLHCSTIAEDIETCQSQGIKVLLSLGGASGNYGFSSDSEAEEFAEVLWNKFGGGSDDERPFDSAVVDGFDFDIENNNNVGYAALATKLRSYYSQDSSKTYYISAAPQCPYPDASVGNLLSNADVDFAFIQFYNNYCSLGSSFNFDTWQDYATNTSPNKNIKLYLGLPGASSSAGSGYQSASTVSEYLSEIKSDANFGGISLWDASSAFGNEDSSGTSYVAQMKALLEDGSSNSGSTSSSVESQTSATSTSTSTSTTSTSTSTASTSSSTSSLTSSEASTSKPSTSTWNSATSVWTSGTSSSSASSTQSTSSTIVPFSSSSLSEFTGAQTSNSQSSSLSTSKTSGNVQISSSDFVPPTFSSVFMSSGSMNYNTAPVTQSVSETTSCETKVNLVTYYTAGMAKVVTVTDTQYLTSTVYV